MTVIDTFYLIAIAVITLAAVVLMASMTRKDAAKRDAKIAGIRTRLEADHGIQVTYTHVLASLGRADGAVKTAAFSDGTLREVLLCGPGADLVAYSRRGQVWERLQSQDKAEAQ